MKVRYTASARDDLRAIIDFISDRNPTADRRLHSAIRGAAASLSRKARRGSVIERRQDDGERRPLIIEPHPIVYEIEGTTVWINRILHGARDLPKVLASSDPAENT